MRKYIPEKVNCSYLAIDTILTFLGYFNIIEAKNSDKETLEEVLEITYDLYLNLNCFKSLEYTKIVKFFQSKSKNSKNFTCIKKILKSKIPTLAP